MPRVLAVDVGFGTEDVLLYDEARSPENSIKLVLPAMTQRLARRIRAAEGDLFIHGETMGGGPLTSAVIQRMRAGHRVLMTPKAAMSIRDDLEEVRAMGVEIVDKAPPGVETLETMDIDFELLKGLLQGIGVEWDFDWVGIAVQDHGHAPAKSDREFRFERFREALASGTRLHELAFENPPDYYTRMNAVLRTVARHHRGKSLVVDTKIAAIAGALHGFEDYPAISIDVGNGHTMVATVEGGEVLGLLEHHTGALDPAMLEDLVLRFAEGEVTHEEVFNGGGHGCYIREKVGTANVRHILATGPNRGMLRETGLRVEYPNPFGDVMMTGPVGIVDMGRSRLTP
ncbi:MAG: DUF1786 family protein [Candidatus Hydrothermarchaeota archaeon]